ncbi:hypothetical protein M9H77_31720 [Catharanthus roseus]|uniref:Uncharacterized protein n=1 Tax=Catharanthus roseus TaxID=4058 RepID=A0ACC0A548_CATRO|nr:hypothetical protein M9H77_31720 [Catharanthus roseus]
MGYTWSNSSWKRMEAIGRQEIAYSKLTRARSKCYKHEGYDENDYVSGFQKEQLFYTKYKVLDEIVILAIDSEILEAKHGNERNSLQYDCTITSIRKRRYTM